MRRLVLIVFQGRAGDRNERAMQGAPLLGQALAQAAGLTPRLIGTAEPPVDAWWDRELHAAAPGLHALAQALDESLASKHQTLTVVPRCAAAIATLPVVARHQPDVCVVYFDAHGDVNLPRDTKSGYLGGLVLTATAGLWDSGFGGGLPLANVVLVGARDLDPPERQLIDEGVLCHVPVGADLAERLRTAVGGRAVYVHIDCDVLNPGIVPTEYRVDGGLTLADLTQAMECLAAHDLIGVEVAEFEATWPETGAAGSPAPICDALRPILSPA